MSEPQDSTRRTLLRHIALGLSLSPAAYAADAPLLGEEESGAKAVHYLADASHAKDVQPGANCSNCSLYSGATGASAGQCTLFPDRRVAAAGWCNSWSGL